MNSNVNLEAAIGILALLGTAFMLGLAAIIILHVLKRRRRMRARTISIAAVSLIGHENSFWHKKTKFRLDA